MNLIQIIDGNGDPLIMINVTNIKTGNLTNGQYADIKDAAHRELYRDAEEDSEDTYFDEDMFLEDLKKQGYEAERVFIDNEIYL